MPNFLSLCPTLSFSLSVKAVFSFTDVTHGNRLFCYWNTIVYKMDLPYVPFTQ